MNIRNIASTSRPTPKGNPHPVDTAPAHPTSWAGIGPATSNATVPYLMSDIPFAQSNKKSYTLCSQRFLRGYILGGITVHVFHILLTMSACSDTVNYLTPISAGNMGVPISTIDPCPNVSAGKIDEPTSTIDRCSGAQEFFDVMNTTGTDKISRHGYHWFYGPHFSQYKSKRGLNVLEIGAKEGRSAAGWTKYFDDSKIDMITYGGANNDLNFTQKECELGDCSKVELFEGDQSDTDFLDTVLEKRKDGWDIIIDDASVSKRCSQIYDNIL